mgnify:FL=1
MSKVYIDTEKRIFTVNGEDFGDKCTCIEIKITPDDCPEVILHLIPDIEANINNCEIQGFNDAAIDIADDNNVPIVEMSVN